jgi:hypothetical protein
VRKLVTAAIELAFKKHQMAAMGEEKGTARPSSRCAAGLFLCAKAWATPPWPGWLLARLWAARAASRRDNLPHCNAPLTAQSPPRRPRRARPLLRRSKGWWRP